MSEKPMLDLQLAAAKVAAPDDAASKLQMAIAAGMLELLRRTGWKELKHQRDMPDERRHVLVWLKGGQFPAQATCNFNTQSGLKYFLLANMNAHRAMEEVTHWLPMPGGPYD